VTIAYKALAAGRYAAEWLPEFLILYDTVVVEEGDDAAHDWAIGEFKRSLRPASAARALWILRLARVIWKVYRAVVD
jgi:hypothetical protein